MPTRVVARSEPAEEGGVAGYMLNYFASLQALEESREKLRRAASDESLAESQRAQAAAAFLDMATQIAHLADAHETFMRQFVGPGVEPPGDALIEKSSRLAKALAVDIARKQTAAALLSVVTRFVNAWASLAGAGGGAAAAVPAAPGAAVPAAPGAAVPAVGIAAAKTPLASKKAAAKGKRTTQPAAGELPAGALNLRFLKRDK
jgi:hypothetical protein